MSLSVVVKSPTKLVRADAQQPTVADMLQAMIDKGVTAENVAAFGKLVELSEHMEDRLAERSFAEALVKLQADVKNVKAIRPVIVGGQVRYMFAPYEDLMNEVAPHLNANGFSVSYSTEFQSERIIKRLKLLHVGTHFQTNDYAVKVSKPLTNREGKETVSEAQMESMAGTTAKRGALCDALNIVVEKYEQDDARMEGGTITAEQAADLKRRVMETGSNEEFFLKFAGASDYKDIPAVKYSLLDEQLRRKEKTT